MRRSNDLRPGSVATASAGDDDRCFSTRFHRRWVTLAESRLLSLAVEGLSDDKVASVLEISVHTIKQSWLSIFARAEAVVPAALGPQTRAAMTDVRGAEKRRHLLVFLGNHPEELRPCLLS